jgi:quinol monooxygenase YgiN
MVNHTVRLAVDLMINEGKLDAFETVARTMVAGSQKEAGTLGYHWYRSANRRKCRLLETYTDANAALAHFNGPVVRELVPKLMETASVSGFEVYGEPGPKLREMLAAFGAEVFGLAQGLDR